MDSIQLRIMMIWFSYSKINFRYLYIFIFISLLSIFNSCSSTKPLFSSKNIHLKNIIENSDIFKNEFAGFVLYDIKRQKQLVNINGNKYFTPASNTKLYTFYTSLMVLQDSMPLLRYIEKGDSLIFWGTGSPLSLNPDLTNNTFATDFLKNNNKELFYCNDNFFDEKYGSGWAWDDYMYYYQLEKSAFPIFGNKVVASYNDDKINISPKTFGDKISFIEDSNEYWRPEFDNSFIVLRVRLGICFLLVNKV